VEEFAQRSTQSNVNDGGRLKRSVHHAASTERAVDSPRSYLELPAPVLVGAMLLGGVLAKNDDDDLTFASLAILFLLYAFHVAGKYVSEQRRRRALRPERAASTG
jgi:glycerol uptake facilitator-like aquaporin